MADELANSASQLHPDLLVYIFVVLCANQSPLDEFGPTPLELLRCVSQVCRYWRVLVLSCSPLWAHHMNLDHLNQRNGYWRSEVLRRTGGALLSLRGTVHDGPKAIGLRAFLVWVLTSHWVRIRVLNLTILDEDLFRNAGAITTNIFQRAAPNLEYFRMVFRHGLPAVFSSPSFMLFANKAPQLVQYHGMVLPYRLNTPWVSHIRVLYLTMDSPLVVRELVFALQSASFLEALSISHSVQDVEADYCHDAHWATVYESRLLSSPPHASLPTLRYFEIAHTLSACLFLLHRIEPGPQCDLNLVAFEHPLHITKLSPSNNRVDAAQMALARIARSFFLSQQEMAPALGVWVSDDFLEFYCFGLSSDGYDPLANYPILCVRFKWEGAAGGEISKKLFFGVVSSCALSHSKSLTVEITSGCSRSRESAENEIVNGTGTDTIDSTFVTDLCACFEFVEELRSDTGTLRFIYDASLSGASDEREILLSNAVPFPLIRKLSIMDWGGDSRDAGDHDAIEDLLHFLVWRQGRLEAMGKGTLDTIDFFDLTGCTWASVKGVIEVLMSELGRRGFWDATVKWAKEVEAGENGYGGDNDDCDDDEAVSVGIPGGKVFGVGDGAGVDVDGGGLTYEELVCILILGVGVAFGLWWDYVGAEMQ